MHEASQYFTHFPQGFQHKILFYSDWAGRFLVACSWGLSAVCNVLASGSFSCQFYPNNHAWWIAVGNMNNAQWQFRDFSLHSLRDASFLPSLIHKNIRSGGTFLKGKYLQRLTASYQLHYRVCLGVAFSILCSLEPLGQLCCSKLPWLGPLVGLWLPTHHWAGTYYSYPFGHHAALPGESGMADKNRQQHWQLLDLH